MEILFDFSPWVVAIVPVIVGLVQVIKGLGLPSTWAPAASVLLGVGLVALTGVTWQAMIAQGIVAGLAASGLYAGGRKMIGE